MNSFVPRSKYIDCVPGVPPTGYDLVELKYDGHFALATIEDGDGVFISRTGKIIKTFTTSLKLPKLSIIGELLRGTAWSNCPERSGQFMVFDALEIGESVYNESLKVRRQKLVELFDGPLPDSFNLVAQFPFSHWEYLWNSHTDFEGLIFKSSTGPYGDTYARMKREYTADFVCMGMNPGKGKFAGTLGSLQGGRDGKHILDVSGFTDVLRKELWDNKEKYIGRTFEAKGKALFSSGALRHPIFVRWRDDIL